MTLTPSPQAQGRAQGLDDFLRRDRRDLWAFCYQMLGSPFDAQDAVQDVLERVWRSRGDFDAGVGSAGGWVFRIARNVCLDRLRSAARRTLPRDLTDPGLEVGAPLVPQPDTPWLQPAPSSWRGVDATGDAAVRGRDLVDEYRLLVFPTAVGTGRRLFTAPQRLRLTGSEPVGPGTLLTLEPDGRS